MIPPRTGAIAIFVTSLIAGVQQLGFSSACDGLHGFLGNSSCTPKWHRLATVTCGGIFGAIAWYWLRGRDTTIVGVKEALKGAKMPPGVTLLNAIIQDVLI